MTTLNVKMRCKLLCSDSTSWTLSTDVSGDKLAAYSRKSSADCRKKKRAVTNVVMDMNRFPKLDARLNAVLNSTFKLLPEGVWLYQRMRTAPAVAPLTDPSDGLH